MLTLLGGVIQGIVNGTIHAPIVAVVFLFGGLLLVAALFRGAGIEMRAFALSYAICIFLAGVVQSYAVSEFSILQSTIDANTFLGMIAYAPPFTTIDEMPAFNAPLAVLIWQQVYKVTWFLNLDQGLYIGLMFNAFVIGLGGSMTIAIARVVLGSSPQPLRRVGVGYALCGMMWLFGTIFIRDCFTTIVNLFVLWSLVRWVAEPSFMRFVTAVVVSGVSFYIMIYLRFESIFLFGVYWFLGLLTWFQRRRMDVIRLLVLFTFPLIILVLGGYFRSYMQTAIMARSIQAEGYAVHSSVSNRQNSLGMRLIINQPLPIRVVLGSGSLAINPIPLWASFYKGSSEYNLLKGYHGIFIVIMMPFALAGTYLIGRRFMASGYRIDPALFLVVYYVINVMAVAATSLETRHIGQYAPVFLIIAAIPDPGRRSNQSLLRNTAVLWGGMVMMVHILWMVKRGI